MDGDYKILQAKYRINPESKIRDPIYQKLDKLHCFGNELWILHTRYRTKTSPGK